MNADELIAQISDKNLDIDRFVQQAIEDRNARDEIVRQMVANPNIMVYYHCYYVVDKASQERPDLFYPYWSEIAPLLKHKNSYHRDFAMTILANLTRVDDENLFSRVRQASARKPEIKNHPVDETGWFFTYREQEDSPFSTNQRTTS
jgi:hypothetical protein